MTVPRKNLKSGWAVSTSASCTSSKRELKKVLASWNFGNYSLPKVSIH